MKKIEFTKEQLELIRRKYARDASPDDFAVLIEQCEAKGLNPLLGQVYFQSRKNHKTGQISWACQTSIDGFRGVAESTGEYQGQGEPEFDDREGRLYLCRVRVYRKSWPHPVVGVAHYAEFVQASSFWDRMPHVMLSKCAEAIALRKAFPADLGSLYVKEELGGEEEEDSPTPIASPAPPAVSAAPRAPASAPKAPVSSPGLLEADFIMRIDATMSVEVLGDIYREARKEGGLSSNALKRVEEACRDKKTLIKQISENIRDSENQIKN